MKLVSIILTFAATFIVLSSTSVPSVPSLPSRVPESISLPVQHYDFEESPMIISVKK